MEFGIAIKNLNQLLKEKQPKEFDSSWIEENTIDIYQYICENIRTENDDVDWDKVTSSLDRPFQRRWNCSRHKKVEFYRSRSEVDIILNRYDEKLYTIISPISDDDKEIQHWLIIDLVRMGQKGNLSAQEELIIWLTYLIYDWIDRYPQIRRWKGYTDEIEDKIKICIRCYRYTGSFLNYLFRTLEYSARGKPPILSLDDPILNGKRARVDFILGNF